MSSVVTEVLLGEERQDRSVWCWATIVEVEFHHLMRDPEAPDDPERLGRVAELVIGAAHDQWYSPASVQN